MYASNSASDKLSRADEVSSFLPLALGLLALCLDDAVTLRFRSGSGFRLVTLGLITSFGSSGLPNSSQPF